MSGSLFSFHFLQVTQVIVLRSVHCAMFNGWVNFLAVYLYITAGSSWLALQWDVSFSSKLLLKGLTVGLSICNLL